MPKTVKYVIEEGAIPVGGSVEDNETILQEANRLVYGDRAADYGNAAEEADKMVAGWSIIIGSLSAILTIGDRTIVNIPPEAYPLCMAWVKIVRQTNKAKRDNLVDLAGYAGVAEKIERGV